MADQGSRGELATLHDVDSAATGGAATAFAARGFAQRYERGVELGTGGMGEVHAWRDRATGREVAMKTIRGDARDSIAARRFAREARVQAQLEHPSIVPVYDVGVAPDGALYFTMKRVRGHSLARVLADGPDASGYSLRKLLTVIARIATTLEYAHRRGVVNRDLKPANIMLGAFDEVYVIDWGLAQVRDAPALGPALGPMTGPTGHVPVRPATPVTALLAELAAAGTPLLDSSQRPETGADQLLGTLGYVAPEQLERPDQVDRRADIYALGAILFEVLTGERMHHAETALGVMIATIETDGASPAARAAAREPARVVPPELDALVHAATRLDPANRPASAAELAAAIDAYLDGDRDLARRRELSQTAATAAERALTASRTDPDDELALRARAMRDVGRALALDPDNPAARATLLHVLTEPPRRVPPAAEAAYRAGAIRSLRVSARNASFALLSYAAYLPFLLWMGVRRPWLLTATALSIVAVAATTYLHYRRPPAQLGLPWSHLALSTVALGLGVSLFGPLVLLPCLVIITGVAYIATFDRSAIRCLVPALAVVFVPLGLQLAGIWPASYSFINGEIHILPGMTELPPLPTVLLLIVTHVIVIAGSLLFVWRLRCSHREVERRLALQAWQLTQFIPAELAAAPRAVDEDV